MRRGTTFALIALLLIALAFAASKYLFSAGILSSRPDEMSAQGSLATAGKGTQPMSRRELGESGQLVAKPSRAVSIVMPPADVPVAEVIRRLEAAAKSGNVAASCRIAIDLQDCAGRKSQLAAADAVQKSIQTTGASSQKLENIAGGLLAASARLEVKCAGITDQQLASAFAYQLSAARGDPELARWLVANPALDRSLFMDQFEGWQSYKKFSDQYLARALSQPSPDDFPILLAAYKPRGYPNIEVLHREDPATFLALVTIAQASGATLPEDILQNAIAMRSNPEVVEAASRRRSELEDLGWNRAALDRSSFTPGPLRKPSVEQCAS